jgi:hypothetical protein
MDIFPIRLEGVDLSMLGELLRVFFGRRSLASFPGMLSPFDLTGVNITSASLMLLSLVLSVRRLGTGGVRLCLVCE